MKKILLISAFTLSAIQFFGQACTVCSIDLTCDTTPAYPMSCPANLHTDTALNPYEQTVTFYLPKQFYAAAASNTVTFKQLNVIGISGLPPGLTWTAYDHTGTATNVFYPDLNPPSTERICAKICGTPLVAGNYNVVVSAVIQVLVPGLGGLQSTAQSFIYPLTILPSATGNSAFTMSANSGCESVDVTFNPILPSNGNPLYEYSWDFGNGDTSTLENPPIQHYTTVGQHSASLITKVYKYRVTAASVTNVDDDAWCGDADELICSLSKPDFYFTVNDNASLQTSSEKGSNKNPTWTGLNMVLNSNQIILQVWDADAISADDDMGSQIININGVGVYNFTLTSPSTNSTSVTGSITIGKVLTNTYGDTDLVTVYALPTVTTPTSTFDSICNGDTTILLQAQTTFAGYQWYNNNVVLPGENMSSYTATQTGSYSVQVTDSNGCSDTSLAKSVVFISYPLTPSIYKIGSNLNLTFAQPGVIYRWFKNGVLIPGATANQYTPTTSGTYTIEASNSFGCKVVSNEIVMVVIPQGIEELNTFVQLQVYPNPSTGIFTLDMNIPQSQNLVVTIEDIMGRTVKTLSFDNAYGSIQKIVNIENVNSGVYFINVTNEKNERISNRIMISK